MAWQTTTRVSAPLPQVDRRDHDWAQVLSVASLAVVWLLVIFYLCTSLYIASHRLYWFDELFIVRIAKLPSATAMWQCLAHASDTMPPGYHLLMRIVGHTFGYGELAMRFPSAVGFVIGLLLTFDCTRRVTDNLHGLLALALLTCSLLPYYGYEARPYALYFMLSALALWIWVCTPQISIRYVWLFGAVLSFAVTVHYYAALSVVPYIFQDLLQRSSGKHLSHKTLAGLSGTIIAGAFLAPLALAYSRQFGAHFWAGPSFFHLREAFLELFPGGMFLLALSTIWTVLWQRPNASALVTTRSSAESLGWLFFSIPILGFLVAELKTNAFLIRYFIGALPGFALALACLISRRFANDCRASAGIVALLMLFGIAEQSYTVLHPERIDPFGQQTATRQYLELENSVASSGKQFVLFDDPMLFLEAAHYSRHPGQCTLLSGINDLDERPTVRIQANLSQFSPLHIWTLDDLRLHAAQTALVGPRPELLEALGQAGLKISVQVSRPVELVYLRE
jgi:Dolichyl-phosphate-mannose-protein mannosyltransferase